MGDNLNYITRMKTSMLGTRNADYNVNSAQPAILGSVAVGRRSSKASSVVNQPKPCSEKEVKIQIRTGT